MLAEFVNDICIVGHLHSSQGVKQMEARHLGRLLRVDADRHTTAIEEAHAAEVAVKQPEDERVSRLVLSGVL